MVETFLTEPSDRAWAAFRKQYLALLNGRFQEDRKLFDELADLASENDVFLGCNCPTKKNPIVGRCHTYLALEFMRTKFPRLDVEIPK